MLVDANDYGRRNSFDGGAGKKYENSYKVADFHPDSILHPVMTSDNGYSQKDASRRLLGGGMLPSPNGISADTYKRRQPLYSPYASF